jgi:hypothetical protein
VDRAALGRSGVSGSVSLVQHATLLAGSNFGTARANFADGGIAAERGSVLEVFTDTAGISDQLD